MTLETISNVLNKYVFAKESSYGVIPGSPTLLDIGNVQSISFSEGEGTEQNNAINTGHTPHSLEDGLHNVTGTITTRCTKSALHVLTEALLGDLDLDEPTEGKYTVISSPVTSATLSYFLKVNMITGKTLQVTGIHFVSGEISVSLDGYVEFTLDFQAKRVNPASESINPLTVIGKPFLGFDASISVGGNPTRLDEFSVSLDWSFDIGDSRGIESVPAGERRLIQRIIRNGLSVTGSFTSDLDDSLDTGYVADRDNVSIVLTISRGTTNEHVFTIPVAKTSTRDRELEAEGSKRTMSVDFIGTDLSVVGDLFDES